MAEIDNTESAPEITPQVLHLRDLLKWVQKGSVRVPNFQRDFTWDRPRMLNLFDSIRRQYPIGTLLFWESAKPRRMVPHLGPLALPEFSGGKLLVLDGQQRLTTLAGVLLFDLMERSAKDDIDPRRWRIWYDAMSDDFTHCDDEAPPKSAVRVADLMGTKGLYAAAQRIMSDKDVTHDVREKWTTRMETVSAALSAYRLPLVIFATESLKLVVESFARVNRSGQSLGPDEMLSALTYSVEEDSEHFRLATSIDQMVADIERKDFGQVDRVAVLRVVLLVSGYDPFRTDWDLLAEEPKKEMPRRLQDGILRTRKGLLGAVDFLQSEGIHNHRLLPYRMQLVGLAAFFANRDGEPTQAQRALLRRWLWVSAFTEGFGGLNPSRVLQQLKQLHDVIPTQAAPTRIEGIDLDAEAHPFPERHDHRSARVRALICVLLKEATKGLDGVEVTPKTMAEKVLKRGPQALVKVCAKVECEGRVLLGSSPANRVFDITNTRGQAKKWLLALEDDLLHSGVGVLDSHHISTKAMDALKADDHAAFVKERIKTLMQIERAFMKEKGVIPYKSDQPAPSAMDVEDDAPLSDGPDEDESLG